MVLNCYTCRWEAGYLPHVACRTCWSASRRGHVGYRGVSVVGHTVEALMGRGNGRAMRLAYARAPSHCPAPPHTAPPPEPPFPVSAADSTPPLHCLARDLTCCKPLRPFFQTHSRFFRSLGARLACNLLHFSLCSSPHPAPCSPPRPTWPGPTQPNPAFTHAPPPTTPEPLLPLPGGHPGLRLRHRDRRVEPGLHPGGAVHRVPAVPRWGGAGRVWLWAVCSGPVC